MWRTLFRKKLQEFERATGESPAFMARILDKKPSLFFYILLFMPLLRHRRQLPKEAFHIARIIAVKQEDCGECLQTSVALAAMDDMPAQWIEYALSERWDALPKPLNLVAEFVYLLGKNDPHYESVRLVLKEYYTSGAMLELASAIASGRYFPTAKKAAGMALSCQKIQIRIEERVNSDAA